MFKRKPSSNATVDTLIGGKTRINGDVEFSGGLHLDGHINGNVVGDAGTATFLSVSEHGCIEGSVIAPSVILNGIVKGDIEAGDRIELGSKARVLGNVHYSIIETAVGAQINGKLIHRVKSPDGANQAPGVAISPDTEPAFPAPSNGEE
jgi:cytoskeletal protein CcmA (bactofilin family)